MAAGLGQASHGEPAWAHAPCKVSRAPRTSLGHLEVRTLLLSSHRHLEPPILYFFLFVARYCLH